MARSAGAVGDFRDESSLLSGMSGRWMQADVVPGLFDTDIEDGEGLYFVMDGMAGRVLISGTTIIERS